MTNRNCAGGTTPWRTWLSCEEVDRGYAYETDPWGGAAARRPAMGRFTHEAAACDPVRRVVYLTEDQVSGAKRFNGGEGCYYADDACWFTTKGDNRVWRYDAAAASFALAYDDSLVSGTAPLNGVDNITGSVSGDLFVAEDGGNMEVNIITPDGVVAPFLRTTGQGRRRSPDRPSHPTGAGSTSPPSAARRAPRRAASRTR